eukprot:SM000196S05361  [mRNA]  locus=s196:70945:71781:+ [translate_table: standard]
MRCWAVVGHRASPADRIRGGQQETGIEARGRRGRSAWPAVAGEAVGPEARDSSGRVVGWPSNAS